MAKFHYIACAGIRENVQIYAIHIWIFLLIINSSIELLERKKKKNITMRHLDLLIITSETQLVSQQFYFIFITIQDYKNKSIDN